MAAIRYNGAISLGAQEVRHVFHGSEAHFTTFKDAGYNSIGVHFGDLAQAKFFAGRSGQIIKATLHFNGLLDVGSSDLGWTSEIVVAAALREKMRSTVGIIQERFDEILAASPASFVEMAKTAKLSGESSRRLVRLLDAHGIDGIKYTNRFRVMPLTLEGDKALRGRNSSSEVNHTFREASLLVMDYAFTK